jgi:hypothetical protein
MHPHHRGVAVKGEWTGRISPASEAHWRDPFKYRSGTFCFTCSMSDFSHEDVPLDALVRALDTIDATPWVTYLILTKRPALGTRRLAMLNRRLPGNVWAGATVGHPKSLPLLKPLLGIEAPVHFLSVEPLLAPMVSGLDLSGIDWVIGGGESVDNRLGGGVRDHVRKCFAVRKDRRQLDIAVELAVCDRGRRRIARADRSCLDRTIGDAQHAHYGGREAYCRGRLRCLPIGHRILLFARTAPGEAVSRVD